MAAVVGPYENYERNKQPHDRVIEMRSKCSRRDVALGRILQ